MSIINSEIENDILDGLKLNHATNQSLNRYTLPKFQKLESGEYVYVGNALISTIKEYKEYKKAYGEIAKHLKGYTEMVAKIYKNALNSLIAENGKYQFGENAYSLKSKLSNGSFPAVAVESDNTENYEKTLNYITKAAYQRKRLKPCSKLNHLMKEAESVNKNEEKLYVLPVMTENGIVLSHNRHTKSLEANFETLTENDALKIKEYFIENAKKLNPVASQQVAAQVEKLFKNSKHIGEMIESGYNEDLAEKLEKLAVNFSDLIGVDLSRYNKSVKASKYAEHKPENVTTEKKTSVDVQEILIDGTYKTAPALEDGKIVTKLTPNGVKFTLQLKNDKFFIKNVEEEKGENFDFSTLERQ